MIRSPFALALAVPIALASTGRAERHPVFSLVDNLPLGHLQRRGGLYIAAGSSGMAKYVRFSRPLPTWKLRAVEDGRRVALAQAQATLEVPLTKAQAEARVVHFGLKAPASSVKVSSRGKASAAVALKAGWQIVTVQLPENALQAGENTLSLQFAQWGKFGGQRAAAAVQFVQIGGSAPDKADTTRGLALSAGNGVAWYAYVPKGGAFVARGDGACKLTVRADDDTLAVAADGAALDLGLHAGRFVRLEVASGGECALREAHLDADGAPPSLPPRQPPRNVVFWLTDDTRADKYRFWNPSSRVETPVFDELRKSSTVFRVAYTQGNESRVSHASIWTSMYPSVHQMIAEKAKLKPEFVTLAEAVRPSGRVTLGVMGNGFIDQFWGFGDGWDFLRNNIHDQPQHGLTADALLADALRALDDKAGGGKKPFFLYVGTIDAHVSWKAHEPWLRKYDPEPYSGRFVKMCSDPDLDKIVAGKLAVSERDKQRIVALYDSDVSYNDHVLGKLVEELRKRGHLDDTLIVLASDHGEELWDHGRIGHGQSLREELVHVPLLFRYPPYFPSGKVVDEGVDVMDVLPTLTDVLGAPTPDGAQGESLAPLAAGIGAGYPRPAIASQYELAHTMRLDRFKMWVGGSGDVRLFDVAADGREEHDLAATRPVERRALTDALGTFMAFRNQWKKRRWGVPSNLLPAFAADLDGK